jgi:hypothetical protein
MKQVFIAFIANIWANYLKLFNDSGHQQLADFH